MSLTLVFAVNSAFGLTELPNGNFVLTPKELAQLNTQINFLVQEAFKQGALEALETLKNNPKLCPKDT